MTIKSIAFTMYPVIDMARARRFYEETLGLHAAREFEGQWVEYDLDGGTFALANMVVYGLTPSATSGGSIGFEVEDVDDLVTTLKRKGTTIKLEPLSTPVCRMAVVLDPEGNAITLHQVTHAW